jgi:hypothetical protein
VSYQNTAKVTFMLLATGYWLLAAGLLSLATFLRVGQQQEASSQKLKINYVFATYTRDSKLYAVW